MKKRNVNGVFIANVLLLAGCLCLGSCIVLLQLFPKVADESVLRLLQNDKLLSSDLNFPEMI